MKPIAYINVEKRTLEFAKNIFWHTPTVANLDRIPLFTKEVLAQPEQEPVALEAVYETIIQWDEGGGKRSRRELARRIVALYTTPPQRTEQEPVAYSGNGTAGREADVRPTGFFFQMPKPIGEVYGWHGSGKGQPMCRFDTTEAEMPVGTKLYIAPPQPEQEPVAFWNFNSGFSHCMIDQLNEAAKKNPAPLYTTPPQRTEKKI